MPDPSTWVVTTMHGRTTWAESTKAFGLRYAMQAADMLGAPVDRPIALRWLHHASQTLSRALDRY
jgi:hypothetical protein